MSLEDELDECEDDDDKEWVEELRGSIDELKESLEDAEKAIPSPYYACGQLYITKHALS